MSARHRGTSGDALGYALNEHISEYDLVILEGPEGRGARTTRREAMEQDPVCALYNWEDATTVEDAASGMQRYIATTRKCRPDPYPCIRCEQPAEPERQLCSWCLSDIEGGP